MLNTNPPSTLPKTSDEPSQTAIQISLWTHTNALNHVLQLKTSDTHRAQHGPPPVWFSHLHQQLLTGHYYFWVTPSNAICHGGKKTPSALSPGLAELLCTLPELPSRGCPCAESHCVPAVGGEHGGVTVSLAGSVPGWREGGTMGMGTSLDWPVPSVQCITPARSPHTATYCHHGFKHRCTTVYLAQRQQPRVKLSLS